MSAARLLDPDVLMAIYNDDHEWLRAFVEARLAERRRRVQNAG